MATELREIASEALCHFPGQYWMINLYLKVFCFSLNCHEFEIFLWSLSPNNPFTRSGFVITMRLEPFIRNMQHFSNAHAIAAALPSIDTYQCRIYCQQISCASLQDIRLRLCQLCMNNVSAGVGSPFLFAPVWSEAGDTILFKCSNVVPSWNKSTITCLESWNAAERLWFYMKCESHLTRSWNRI